MGKEWAVGRRLFFKKNTLCGMKVSVQEQLQLWQRMVDYVAERWQSMLVEENSDLQ